MLNVISQKKVYTGIIFNLFSFCLVYSIPYFAHLTSLPLYYLEPMRWATIAGMVFFNRKNAYLLAITLPLFSFIVSGHPLFLKSILISGELILNVFLWVKLSERLNTKTLALPVSIIATKIFYYTGKFLLISSGLLVTDLVATPLMWQLFTVTGISVLYFIHNSLSGNSDHQKI